MALSIKVLFAKFEQANDSRQNLLRRKNEYDLLHIEQIRER